MYERDIWNLHKLQVWLSRASTSSQLLEVFQGSARLLPRLHKIHQIKKALLVVSLLSRPIDLLNPKLLRVVSKLPIISETPCKRTHNIDTIFIDRLQDL